jgi:GNAT superfamily N-acetyltransferase
MVGAATGMPLTDHDDDFAAAFERADIDMKDVFYCAESVLLSEYRGQGAGHVFFDRREAHARALGFGAVAFCGVIRPEDHPMRPEGYRPLDAFWRARGYAPVPGVVAEFGWTDIGETDETKKPLQFWMMPPPIRSISCPIGTPTRKRPAHGWTGQRRRGPIFWCFPNTGAWNWRRSTGRRPRAIWSGACTPPPAGPKRPTR